MGRFCGACGTAIAPGADACPQCGKVRGATGQPPLAVGLVRAKVPWFLTWFFILPVCLVDPEWYLPAGLVAGFGLMLIRTHVVPSSAQRIGCAVGVLALMILAMAAVGLLLLSSPWARYPLIGLATVAACFLLSAALMIRRGNQLKLLRDAIYGRGLLRIDQIAAATGEADQRVVARKISTAVARGLLPGYAYDSALQTLAPEAKRSNPLQLFVRSKTGTAFVLLGILMLFGVLDDGRVRVAASVREFFKTDEERRVEQQAPTSSGLRRSGKSCGASGAS